MTNKKSLQYFLVGDGHVTKAVGKVLELFGAEGHKNNGLDNIDIMVLADGDNYEILKNKISDNSKIIYLELKDERKTENKHKLYFLTHILPTYRIPQECFSIVELARIIEDIEKGVSG